MTFGNTFNGVIRRAYLGVTFPIHATGRMVYGSARGIVQAIGRVCVDIGNKVVGGIRVIAHGIQSTIHSTGAAFTSAFRSLINGIVQVSHNIAVGILPVGRATLGLMRRTQRLIATLAIVAAKVAAMPFTAIYRAAKRFAGTIGRFIGLRYRAFVFNLASTTMTLSLEEGQARLLVLKGDRIIAWRSGQIAQPPDEPAEDPNEDPADANADEEEVEAPAFNPLGSLLEGLPARSKRVITDLPLYIPLLRHVPLPDVKGRYLREIVNAEILDSVPFAADEVDIRWRIEQGDDIREASVVAVPRDRMDGQVGIVRDSKLAPSAVYPKAAALAAAVALPDVFILHITQVRFHRDSQPLVGAQTAVVLVRGGVPRIVHRLDMPQDMTEQAEAIAMGVEQVAGYHRSQRPEDDVSGVPVVVTGEVKQVQDLIDLLASTLGRPIQAFEPALECPEGFDPAEYASNIGLFLASRSKESAKVIAAQNVLPERHRPRPLPVVPAAVFVALLGLGFLAVSTTGWVSGIAGEIDSLNIRLELREDQARAYRLAVATQNVVDQEIDAAEQEARELEDNLALLELEMDTLMSRLNDITSNADSSNVDLSQVVPMPDGFSVLGSAESYSDGLGYAASMRSSVNFEDATVLQVAEYIGERLEFTVAVTVPVPQTEEDEEPVPQAQSP